MKMYKEKNEEFPSREILYIKKFYEGFCKNNIISHFTIY